MTIIKDNESERRMRVGNTVSKMMSYSFSK